MDMQAQKITGEWFTEAHSGLGLSVQIKEHLYSKKSPFQQIDIYDTAGLGRMLVLDGIIQLTEFDEFCYQEMMAHVPLFAHPDPRRVLVIGGGDGGVLREIAKHDCVEEIDICEIDGDVIEASKKYLKSLACGYDDPRVKVHVMDGNEFIKERQGYYDVIIVDSTDPIGPGEVLFGEKFYQGMRNTLRDGGIITSQSESIFLHPDVIARLLTIIDGLFDVYGYAAMFVPTYPGGNIGASVASLGPEVAKPARFPSVEMQDKLRYYTPDIHEAAFKLPKVGMDIINKVKGK
jgi:spermidine synthase